MENREVDTTPEEGLSSVLTHKGSNTGLHAGRVCCVIRVSENQQVQANQRQRGVRGYKELQPGAAKQLCLCTHPHALLGSLVFFGAASPTVLFSLEAFP